MTWQCHYCWQLNTRESLICGSLVCQDRRVRESANGPVDGPASPVYPLHDEGEDVGSKPLEASKALEPKNPRPKRKFHEYPAEFEAFWSVYPKREDKIAALKAWKRVVAGSATAPATAPAVLTAAAARYRNNPLRKKDYTKLAERWLNAGSYLDDEGGTDAPESHAPQETDWEAYRAEEDARIAALLAEEEASDDAK